MIMVVREVEVTMGVIMVVMEVEVTTGVIMVVREVEVTTGVIMVVREVEVTTGALGRVMVVRKGNMVWWAATTQETISQLSHSRPHSQAMKISSLHSQEIRT